MLAWQRVNRVRVSGTLRLLIFGILRWFQPSFSEKRNGIGPVPFFAGRSYASGSVAAPGAVLCLTRTNSTAPEAAIMSDQNAPDNEALTALQAVAEVVALGPPKAPSGHPE